MDGDRLGKLLQTDGVEREDVSRALSLFTEDIEDKIREKDGVTVYAGGDDVLAMFPMDKAIPAAVMLRNNYREAFVKVFGEDRLESLKRKGAMPGISAGIVFAHYMVPLSGVITHAHHLLDDVAKEKTGRNSIAIGVWKRSGPDLVWSMPWDLFGENENDTLLHKLAKQLGEGDERGVSGSFLHKLREQLSGELQFDKNQEENREILTGLIAADYMRATRQVGKEARDKAEEMSRTLLAVCLRSFYKDDGQLVREQMPLSLDGALLARFLAEKGSGSD
jgi:CRISPR-associated protein Cmr2